MSYQGTFENILRIGVIESINYIAQTCFIKMYDSLDDRLLPCPLPQPSAGTNTGFFHHIEPGSLVLVGWGLRETPYICSVIPNSAFVKDVTSAANTRNIPVDTTENPFLAEGELTMMGAQGSEIKINQFGCIEFTFGNGKFFLDPSNKSVLAIKDKSIVTEAGTSWDGTVLRDLRFQTTLDEETENKKSSLSSFRVLNEIGREPFFTPVRISSGLTKGFSEEIRNPAFVERKTVIKEFADSYKVGTFDEEGERLTEEDNFDFLFQPNRRDETRYDVLNLNPDFPNTLIEKVEGTLIDIYGNLVDLNRNVIRFPADQEGRKAGQSRLEQLSALTKRSVKLHYEINSRKDAKGEVAVNVLDGPDLPIGHNLSRWSVDVDGEGLTKINIPASSNIGNIPLLTRYVTSHQEAKRKDVDFRAGSTNQGESGGSDQEGESSLGSGAIQDILHLGFAAQAGSGVTTTPETYLPVDLGGTGKINYRTAYHDIVNTASRALPVGTLSTLQTTLDNTLPEPGGIAQGNAGGRSLFANLDGSLELNIGRDTIDHKSIVLDTSGGIVSRIGKTTSKSNNASIISQLDGHVYIQVGGSKVLGDEEVKDPEVKLVVKDSKGISEIVIDANTLKVKGGNGKNVIVHSQGDLVLSAARQILLMSKMSIGVGGAADVDTGARKDGPWRNIQPKGKEI